MKHWTSSVVSKNSETNFNKRVKSFKGLALAQILLSIALGSIISIGVVGYYNHTSDTQKTQIIADNVVDLTLSSSQRNSVGLESARNVTVNGVQVTAQSGKATLSSLSSSSCRTLSAQLATRGDVTSSNCGSSQLNNTIHFASNSKTLDLYHAMGVSSGVSEEGANNVASATDLTGKVVNTGSSLGLGDATGSISTGDKDSLDLNQGLDGGKDAGVVAGGTYTAPSQGSPPLYTGSGSMACRWRLTNSGTIYDTKNLGTRTTPCASGSVSTSNQTGERTYACPNPTAATNPVGTDTWTGGTCALTCNSRLGTGSYVTTTLTPRAKSCPSGQISTSNETGKRTWTCGANGAKAVNPTNVDTWTGGTCATTCATRLGTGTFVTTTLTPKPKACPTGQQSTSNQTGKRTWTCGANSGKAINPVSVDTWTGGTCGVTCVARSPTITHPDCPANQVGVITRQQNYYCPNPTGADAPQGAPFNTQNTCAWNTSCQGYGSNYAWDGNSCEITCASKKPADQYLGTRPTPCATGQTSSSDQVGYKRYSCPTVFGAPTSVDQWTGGGCKANLTYRWLETDYRNYGGWGGMGQSYRVCSDNPTLYEADIGNNFKEGPCSSANAGARYYCSVLVPQSHDELEWWEYTCSAY